MEERRRLRRESESDEENAAMVRMMVFYKGNVQWFVCAINGDLIANEEKHLLYFNRSIAFRFSVSCWESLDAGLSLEMFGPEWIFRRNGWGPRRWPEKLQCVLSEAIAYERPTADDARLAASDFKWPL